ncbi:hypothetical protein K8R33_04600 [archaeon]|nr:hypothetical protein [archaeon]
MATEFLIDRYEDEMANLRELVLNSENPDSTITKCQAYLDGVECMMDRLWIIGDLMSFFQAPRIRAAHDFLRERYQMDSRLKESVLAERDSWLKGKRWKGMDACFEDNYFEV